MADLDALYDRSPGTFLTLNEHEMRVVPCTVDVFLNSDTSGAFLADDRNPDHPAYRDNSPPRSIAAFGERTNRTQALVRTRSNETKTDIPILDAYTGDRLGYFEWTPVLVTMPYQARMYANVFQLAYVSC